METKIEYKKSKLFIDLLLGLAFLGLGIRKIYIGNIDWSVYLIFIVGVGYIALTLFKFFNSYMILSDNAITMPGPPKRKVLLEEVTEHSEFTRGYVIKSGKKTLRISKANIDNKDLSTFQEFYDKHFKS